MYVPYKDATSEAKQGREHRRLSGNSKSLYHPLGTFFVLPRTLGWCKDLQGVKALGTKLSVPGVPGYDVQRVPGTPDVPGYHVQEYQVHQSYQDTLFKSTRYNRCIADRTLGIEDYQGRTKALQPVKLPAEDTLQCKAAREGMWHSKAPCQ